MLDATLPGIPCKPGDPGLPGSPTPGKPGGPIRSTVRSSRRSERTDHHRQASLSHFQLQLSITSCLPHKTHKLPTHTVTLYKSAHLTKYLIIWKNLTASISWFTILPLRILKQISLTSDVDTPWPWKQSQAYESRINPSIYGSNIWNKTIAFKEVKIKLQNTT